MTRLAHLVIAALLLAGASAPVHAAERILSFISDVTIERNGDLRVKETIQVQVEGREIRRGLLRDFATTQQDADGQSIEVGFEVESVTRNGAPEPFATEPLANVVRLRIGRADVLLPHGAHEYAISYRTTRRINHLERFDTLHWSATGGNWAFTIDVAEARITLPEKVPFRQARAYTGPPGAQGTDAGVVEQEPGRVVFRTTRALPPKSALTVLVAWDKGVVLRPNRRADGGCGPACLSSLEPGERQ